MLDSLFNLQSEPIVALAAGWIVLWAFLALGACLVEAANPIRDVSRVRGSTRFRAMPR